MAIDTQQSIFSEVADFLVSQPTLDEIIAYRVSPPLQQYLDSLLDKNSEAGLTSEEREDLDQILAISQLMKIAKAKARLKLANK